MLTTLRIRNLALVADLALELPAGFVAVTGETGAGKSVILGALNLVLGERADRAFIRSGAESCSVEAVFDASRVAAPLADFLDQHGVEPCDGQQLVLKRAFSAAGANRQFVNGTPVTLSLLAELGQWLVDIHGPHEHQSLLRSAEQLAVLDAFGGLQPQVEAFAGLVRQRAALEAQKASLIVDERAYHQQLDLLRYQVNEITAAQLQPEEEEQLERDYGRARNAARLLELAQAARNLLGETENSVLAHAGAAARLLQEVRRIDPAAEPLPAELEQAITSLRELERELSRYCDRIELDPARLQSLEERLNLLNALKRKYGATVQEILAFGQQARSKLRQLEQRDTELSRLNEELRKIDSRLQQAGAELSDARRQAVPRFARAVSQQLADLGFRQAAFSVTIHRQENPLSAATVSPTGFDSVEFQFAPNPGEPARPLRAIASSGELARVMLGLKTVLAAEDQIPVLVFDEVDANIGGETAAIVGEKMRQVARRRQVFCITHLAPVAAAATAHFVVTKSVEDDRAVIAMRCLHEEDRVTELARMLGGQSDVARRHAAALMDSRTKS